MNPSNDNQRDLEQRLDEAGRFCRPRHPGWESLGARLRPREVAARKSVRWSAMAIAASLLVAAALGIALLPGPSGPVLAKGLPIEVERRGIDVTIFNAAKNAEPTLFRPLNANAQQQNAGMALVKDRRMVLHLKKGDNVVSFTDVAASIDPTSVRLVSDTDPIGTKVIEQNFEFDLASADALLKRFLESEITCVGRAGELYEGYLLSFDQEVIVLADRKPSRDPDAKRPKTDAIARNKLKALRLAHKPADLFTRPTLVWKLRTEKPGDHLTTLTYLCGDAQWQADYVALITKTEGDQETLDLKGWVTIDNRSGTTYEDAGLKLIAGDVNRVRDPWAPAKPSRQGRDWGWGRGPHINRLFATKEFAERSFFEYKLYTLNQTSTIKDRQIKQLSLFKADGVGARRRYVCRSHRGNDQHAIAQLLIKNEKQNHLGRPLPKGRVTLMAVDADGDAQWLARCDIDHTAKDEALELEVGPAFDVVYGFRVVETKRPTQNQKIQICEFRIHNHKPHDVQVRAVGALTELHGESIERAIVESTDEYTMHDFKTAYFDVVVKPNSEKTITYTVDYRW